MTRLQRSMTAALIALFSTSASAYVFTIDDFEIDRGFSSIGAQDGFCVLQDDFSSGGPPPSQPNFCSGNPGSYGTLGTFGPESGGKLTMNSSGAAPSTNAAGAPRLVQSAISLSNINPAAPFNLGIRVDDTFSIVGRFDLVVPADRISGYGVRLTDRTNYPSPSQSNDDLQMQVFTDADGITWIRLVKQDFSAGTVTEIQKVMLSIPSGADQIDLALVHTDKTNNLVQGAFQFDSGGVDMLDTRTFFSTQVAMFNGETLERAGFQAFMAPQSSGVPVPPTLLLIAAGLGLLRFGPRRRQGKA